MFETIIICETGGAYQQNITNFSNIQDIIEGDTFKAPVELVGGKYQVKPYFDYDPVRDTDFDTNIFVMDCKQNIQLLFDLPNDLDIKYVNRTYKKDDKTNTLDNKDNKDDKDNKDNKDNKDTIDNTIIQGINEEVGADINTA